MYIRSQQATKLDKILLKFHELIMMPRQNYGFNTIIFHKIMIIILEKICRVKKKRRLNK